MNLKQLIVELLILFVVSFSVTVFVYSAHGSTIAHEQAHVKVMEYYGCKNTIVTYFFPFGAEADCLDYNYTRTQDERFLHSLNEVMDYNNQALIDLIYIVLILNMSMMLVLWSLKDHYVKK